MLSLPCHIVLPWLHSVAKPKIDTVASVRACSHAQSKALAVSCTGNRRQKTVFFRTTEGSGSLFIACLMRLFTRCLRSCLHYGRACVQRPRCSVCIAMAGADGPWPNFGGEQGSACPDVIFIDCFHWSFFRCHRWLASGALHSSTSEADTRPNVEEPKQDDDLGDV